MAVHDQGRIPLFHFDLYRLEHAYELEDTGIFDVLGYEGAVSYTHLDVYKRQTLCRGMRYPNCDIRALFMISIN